MRREPAEPQASVCVRAPVARSVPAAKPGPGVGGCPDGAMMTGRRHQSKGASGVVPLSVATIDLMLQVAHLIVASFH